MDPLFSMRAPLLTSPALTVPAGRFAAPLDWTSMVPAFWIFPNPPLTISWAPSSMTRVVPSGITRVPSMVMAVPAVRVVFPSRVTVWNLV